MSGYYSNGHRRGENSGQQHRTRSSDKGPWMGCYGQQPCPGQQAGNVRRASGRTDMDTNFQQRINPRGSMESYVHGVHMTVEQLKPEHFHSSHTNQYVVKSIAVPNDLDKNWKTTVPHYPRALEFSVSRIAHVTTEQAMNGILDSGGFKGGIRDPEVGPLLWWGLVIGPEEIAEAEERYLDKKFPLQSPEEEPENGNREEEPFLPKFTTSPAFKDGSRYGNFRFSLPLQKVLQTYSTQFCGGKEPILRVWETIVYKQEIMYSVLVHSPDVHCYDNFPILGDNEEGVCAYRNGEIIWRAQAISKTHEFRLKENKHERKCHAQRVNMKVFYMWDHVTLAFHIPEDKLLSFPQEKLIGCLTACRNGDRGLKKLIGSRRAKTIVRALSITGQEPPLIIKQ